MKKRPQISVIIPTFGRQENLKIVLDSLKKQTYQNFEAVVVEPVLTKEAKSFLQKYRAFFPVRVVEQKRRGLVGAVNEGVAHASGEIIIRTDDDVKFTQGWLTAIAQTFALSDKVGGVSGPTIIPPSRRLGRGLFLFFEKFIHPPNLFWQLVGKIYISLVLDGEPLAVGRIFKSGTFSLGSNFSSCLGLKESVEVDYLEACNYAVRKDLVRKVGGFDEGYVELGEWHEPDLCFKIRKLGYKLLFNPKAKLYHLVSQGGVFSARSQTYSRARNFIRFYFKHVKPDSLEKIVKFSVNLFFINGFYLAGFLKTGNFGQLTGLWGTVQGLTLNILRLEK